MFSSLKSFMDIPVGIKPFISRSGTGTISYGSQVDKLGYIEGKVTVVKNELGKEVVSNTQVYLDGSVEITTKDHIVLDAIDYPITTINTFYRDGKADLKVVYL